MANEVLKSESTVWLFGREATDITLADPGDKKLVRVYGFVFHNEFFDLGSPALFVVRGEGVDVEKNAEKTGLGIIPRGLAEDLKIWTHELHDLSTRLDLMSGSFERILVNVELAEDGLQDFVRGSSGLGLPSNLGGDPRRRRGRRWRSEDD